MNNKEKQPIKANHKSRKVAKQLKVSRISNVNKCQLSKIKDHCHLYKTKNKTKLPK